MRIPDGSIERIYYTKYFSLDTSEETILAELNSIIDEHAEPLGGAKIYRDGNLQYGSFSSVVNLDPLQPVKDFF